MTIKPDVNIYVGFSAEIQQNKVGETGPWLHAQNLKSLGSWENFFFERDPQEHIFFKGFSISPHLVVRNFGKKWASPFHTQELKLRGS